MAQYAQKFVRLALLQVRHGGDDQGSQAQGAGFRVQGLGGLGNVVVAVARDVFLGRLESAHAKELHRRHAHPTL